MHELSGCNVPERIVNPTCSAVRTRGGFEERQECGASHAVTVKNHRHSAITGGNRGRRQAFPLRGVRATVGFFESPMISRANRYGLVLRKF